MSASSILRRRASAAISAIITLALTVAQALALPQFSAGRAGAPPVARGKSSPPLTTLAAADEATRARVADDYGRLPLQFEANRGQSPRDVQFISRGHGYSLFLSSGEAVLALEGRATRSAREDSLRDSSATSTASRPAAAGRAVLKMRLLGAAGKTQAEGVGELPGKVNYMLGDDAGGWRTNVSAYRQVRYGEVYPGIDMIYYGNQRQLEYDFVVAPGVDYRAIRLRFDGAEALTIEPSGDLVIKTQAGPVRQHKPVTYQEADGVRREVASRYVVRGAAEIGFEVASYDPTRPLVIDPVLSYSTYLGGNVWGESAADIAVDAQGNAYVLGSVQSPTDFPVSATAVQTAPRGGTDVFVTKLNAAGSGILYSTFLGGQFADNPVAIAVDAVGHAYITGTTLSPDFPTTQSAFMPADPDFFLNESGDNSDVFVAKLGGDGSRLVYSTYLGSKNQGMTAGGIATGSDSAGGIAVDSDGAAWVTGSASCFTFPTTIDALQRQCAPSNGFVSKFSPDGSTLIYSTYINGNMRVSGSAVDASGDLYLAGSVGWDCTVFGCNIPPRLPVTAGAIKPAPSATPSGEGFVMKFNGLKNMPAFNALDPAAVLEYSTYLGGSGDDQIKDIAVDAQGNAHVTGQTTSFDYPVTSGAFQTSKQTGQFYYTGFVTKLNGNATALVYSTFFGGAIEAPGEELAVDSEGNAYVLGSRAPAGYHVTAGAFKSAPEPDSTDTFLTKFDPSGSSLLFSTYLGGQLEERGAGLALDAQGNAYLTGLTFSPDFPTTPGAYDRTTANNFFGGNMDVFVSKIAFPAIAEDTAAPSTSATLSAAPNAAGWHTSDVLITLSAADNDGGSGVREITYSTAGAQTGAGAVAGATASVQITVEGTTTLTYQAEDEAGNPEPARTLTVMLDKTAPSVDCTAPDGAWHNADVSINCTAADGASQLSDASDAGFTLTTSVPAGAETSDASTNSRTVCDVAGNCRQAGPFGGIKVDKLAPTIGASGLDGGIYTLGQPFTASYLASDAGSGVASTTPSAGGFALDTSAVGIRHLTLTATDAAGNSTTATASYTVTYAVALLYDSSKAFKSGRNIPLSFQLTNFSGANVSSAGVAVNALQVMLLSDYAPGEIDETVDEFATNDFVFDTKLKGDSGYTMKLNTNGYATGTYVIVFRVAGDPLLHTAQFQIR